VVSFSPSALDLKLLRDLWKAKGQALAIAVIVACGVGILVMSMGTLDSLEASRADYYETNRFADVFAHVKRAPRSLEARIASIPGVDRVETRIVRDVTIDVEGMAEPAAARLVSFPEHGTPLLNDVTLLVGRLPTPDREDEAVASKLFAEANGFVPGDRVAALINGVRREIAIVGVGLSPEFTYLLPPGGLMPDDRRYGVLWMDREALEAAFDLDGAFNEVSLKVSRGASPETVIDALDGLLDRYGGLGAFAREDHQSHAFLDGELEQLKTIAGIIPPVFIVVAAYLLHSVLARLIDVEREQIGVLKAFGYRNREVSLHYLKFALVIAVLGLLIGYALGMWMEALMTDLYLEFYSFPFLEHRPSAAAFLAGAVVALGSAAAGALGAVRRAARLAPAAAINPEPPPVFGRGPFARLDASGLFDGPTRMILRHVFRWPGRAGATLLGVAAATGLMIATFFGFDSIERMIEVAFERTASYDAAVNFLEVQPLDALREMARLPGVIAAEPHRGLAARLRHGAREENAYIEGVDSTGTMRRVVDGDLRDFAIPEDGIVLSSQLASMLGASRGDRLTLEAMEGRRPVREVYVAAINEDFVGAPSYMDRRAVNRLIREGEMIQGVYLRLDPNQEEAFYEAIKTRPIVGVVTLQRVALQMFHDTIAESQDIMMNIYRLLSGAIAAGVVYNSVRIALSERARELASMRVLGFGRLEASYILLGQSALLVLAALPIGCVFGYALAALIATGMESELYRIPIVVSPASYGHAVIVVLVAAAASALIVRRQIDKLDLIAVLKTRD
jgi:putative ABC transport system permease protein